MILEGTYTQRNKKYRLEVSDEKGKMEIVVRRESGEIVSSFLKDRKGKKAYMNSTAREVYKEIETVLRVSEEPMMVECEMGTMEEYIFSKGKREYVLQLFNERIAGLSIEGEDDGLTIELKKSNRKKLKGDTKNIAYVKLTSEIDIAKVKGTGVITRTVEEIAIGKEDTSWLENKDYYVVRDDKDAEAIFTALDNYDGMIAYDVETSGLRMNCFGKVNSSYARDLAKYNEGREDEDKISADYLVGLIFCVEKDISYYFPVKNKKFKNLYESGEVRNKTIKDIKERYNVGIHKDKKGDMAEYVRNTLPEDFSADCILMERVRNILENKDIVAHGSSFEYKTDLYYDIVTNIKNDTMILHKIMHKFRNLSSSKGERSDLKSLSKKELGIEQWELKDFFDIGKDDKGKIRGKSKSKIDFSYMDLDGTRIYAPADGDCTLCLAIKYLKELKSEEYNHLEYIYNVEVMVACIVGYMEFYGHRIDETKIENAFKDTMRKKILVEQSIRDECNFRSKEEKELALYLENLSEEEVHAKTMEEMKDIEKQIEEIITNGDNPLNLGSPIQVSKLFYDVLKYPCKGERSVGKKVIKPLVKALDKDKNPKYIVAHLYAQYKTDNTLLEKFFGSLPDFMYPGGYIFSSYGTIAAATGRMSCSKPNAQQYPKVISKIVVPRGKCVMMDADYRQIESRCMTALAKEKHMIERYKDPDSDIHTLVASMMFGVKYEDVTEKMRSDAKSLGFGIPFGMALRSLSILISGEPTDIALEDARVKYRKYFDMQPMLERFFDRVKEQASVHRVTRTHWGRERHYSFEDSDGMFSKSIRSMALRQAGNAVVQGTAADILKIGLARVYSYIKKNDLFGKLFLVNIVHDEQLFEIDSSALNVEKVTADLCKCMEFEVEGFPPLYVGAGVSDNWADAKGKKAEIHSALLADIVEKVKNDSIYLKDGEKVKKPEEVIDYMQKLVDSFRENKVINYIKDENNWGSTLHPVIGSLLNLQFSDGVAKEEDKAAFTLKVLEKFIKDRGIEGVESDKFKAIKWGEEDIEDNELEWEEEDENVEDREFKVIEEDTSSIYSINIRDVIRTFGYLIDKKSVGLRVDNLSAVRAKELEDLIENHAVNEEDENGKYVKLLGSNNIITDTPIYVDSYSMGAELKKFYR